MCRLSFSVISIWPAWQRLALAMMSVLAINFSSALQAADGDISLDTGSRKIELTSQVLVLPESIEAGDVAAAFNAWQAGKFQRNNSSRIRIAKKESPGWIAFRLLPAANVLPGQNWVLSPADLMENTRLTLFVPVLDQGNPGYREVIDVHHRTRGSLPGTPTSDLIIPGAFDPARPFFVRTGGKLSLNGSLTLLSPSQSQRESAIRVSVTGFLLGILLAMTLYNLVLYPFVGDRSYLLYVVYILISGLWLMQVTGMNLFIDLAWGRQFNRIFPPEILAPTSALMATLFTYAFLRLRSHAPLPGKLMFIFPAISMALGLASLSSVGESSYSAFHLGQHLNGAITSLVILSVVILVWYRGFSPARYFLVAWTVLGLGVIAMSAGLRLEVFDVIFPRVHTLLLATALASILLSFALGDMIRTFRREQRQLIQRTTELASAYSAKSNYLANMAHELRTPLNAIIGFSAALKSGIGGSLTDKQQEYISDIGDSGQHLLVLINDVLDLSRIESGELEISEEIISIPRQLQRCLPFVKEQSRLKGIEIETDFADDLTGFLMDAGMLRQIVTNLLSNAVKFTPDHGQVTLKAARDKSEDLLISVADNGAGMTADDIPLALRVFTQTETGRAAAEGTGLGLPLAKHMTELHGGTLHIESAAGHGTTVTVRLPGVRFQPAT
jgi:signal transduction histidine kinase